MNRTKWFAPLVAAVVGVAGTAQAGLMPSGVTVLAEGSNWRWQYAIVLPSDNQLKTGDYFTIYDFNGFIEGSQVSPNSDWEFSSQMLGLTPEGVLPMDDAAKPNLTWKYIGPTIDVGQVGLGNFMASSAFQDRVDSDFTSRTHNVPGAGGEPDRSITTTEVPVPGGGPEVPEPATLLLAGLGLPLLGLARLRKKKAE